MNPLLIFKTIGISVGLSGGITGSIFSSFQAFTKIKIEDLLKEKLFEYTDASDLKDLQKKLDESKNTDDKSLQLTKLKEIKKRTEGSTSYDSNGQKLKEWCDKQKPKYIKKLLPSSFESLLLSYIKDFCILTIGEKILETNKYTISKEDENKLKIKAEELNNHKEADNNQKGDITKEKELNEIKTKSKDDKGKYLLDWCQKTYKRTYKDSNDNLWKLANHYCKKT